MIELFRFMDVNLRNGSKKMKTGLMIVCLALYCGVACGQYYPPTAGPTYYQSQTQQLVNAPYWQPPAPASPIVQQGTQINEFNTGPSTQMGNVNSGWRASNGPRQPDFYHYHEHRMLPQQQQQTYYYPQQTCQPTYYQQPTYYYPTYRNWCW